MPPGPSQGDAATARPARTPTTTEPPTDTSPATTRPAALDLLGETRAAIVRALVDGGVTTAPALADELGITTVAVRKHLAVLEEDGYVTGETPAPEGPGRPARRYRLTESGRRTLLRDRTAELADDLLAYLDEAHGRRAVVAFHRWRRQREAAALADAVTAEQLHERLAQLADALRGEGYGVRTSDEGELTLIQTHCAIYDVARDHPELCAHEAAMFRTVLGADVTRRATLANGDHACVCVIKDDAGTAAAPTTTDRPTDGQEPRQ